MCIKISNLLFTIHHEQATFVHAFAEHIPYDNDFFDVIISHSVIEHVQYPNIALQEILRVLKPGGLLRLKCPNFLYPMERHYKRFYVPFLPRCIEQLYFNIRSGRWTKYFYTLNRIIPYFILRFVKKNNLSYKNVSMEKIKKS